jgi:hypothetical protein
LIGSYTDNTSELYGGDLVAILIKPIVDATLIIWNQGDVSGIQLVAATLVPLLLLIFTLALVNRQGVTKLFIITLFAYLVCSSDFIRQSFPLALHYSRFAPLILLLLVVLLVAAPVYLISAPSGIERFLGRLISFGVALVSAVSSYFYIEVLHRNWSLRPTTEELAVLAQQDQVLGQLRQDSGRVLFEYFADKNAFPILTPHYMPAMLSRSAKQGSAKQEVINGLQIQSSLAYQFPTISARELGAEMYSSNLVISNPEDGHDALRVEQLRDFGISTIVSYSDSFTSRLLPFAVAPEKQIGPYKVTRIQDQPLPLIVSAGLPIIGYLDLVGTMPFKYLELLFHADPRLGRRFVLVEVEQGAELPWLTGMIIHGDNAIPSPLVNTVSIPQFPKQAFEHYRARQQVDRGREAYQYIESQIFSAPVQEMLQQAEMRFAAMSFEAITPSLEWDDTGQALVVSDVAPGTPVLINYSYFPYWEAEGGKLYRAGAERMLLVPERREVILRYRKLSAGFFVFGLLISLGAGTLLFIAGRGGRRGILFA